jgi:hypothetical protein
VQITTFSADTWLSAETRLSADNYVQCRYKAQEDTKFVADSRLSAKQGAGDAADTRLSSDILVSLQFSDKDHAISVQIQASVQAY